MKKGCLIAGGVLLLCAAGTAALLYWIFSVTGEAARAADDFLAQVGAGKAREAYDSAAEGLRARQTPEQFAAAVKDMGLTEYASSSWPSRRVSNDEATLGGSVTTKSGATLPLKVLLVRESGAWRVLSLIGRKGGLAADSGGKKLPPDDELRRLVTTTMRDFARAVRANDFTEFLGKASAPLREEMTAAKLRQAFKEFVDKRVDVAPANDVAPAFDPPPALDEKGALVLVGSYPAGRLHVHFRLRYVHEPAGWKLIAINVRTDEGA